uniref:Uncharacterized protein n=1 Tax=uncultured marine virus TaxID=186617 RepID=A0A0F7L4T0_9VIRU|nr:hypothetical protein [uncultured marine virus]
MIVLYRLQELVFIMWVWTVFICLQMETIKKFPTYLWNVFSGEKPSILFQVLIKTN